MTLTTRSMTGLRLLLAALVAVAVFAPVVTSAGESSDDPAALAALYDKQAAEYRAGAERHAKIARAHKAGAGSSKMSHESVAQHCERIAENLTAAAKESEALAESYRSLAKE